MIYLDKDALICDLAETYNVYDYRALSPSLAGVLACGLRDNSRIKMVMSGQKISTDRTINAAILDRLSILTWQNTEDGHNGVNQPPSVLKELLGEPQTETECVSFDSGADFDAYMERINNG